MDDQPERRKNDDIKELLKEAQKEAIREWLDDKYKSFGKWTLFGIVAWLLSAVAHAWLSMNAKTLKEIAGTTIDQISR